LFDASIRGIQLCSEQGIKAGIRFTLTQDNVDDFPAMLDLVDDKDIDKFYLSHLNYGGRGNKNRKDDAAGHCPNHNATRKYQDGHSPDYRYWLHSHPVHYRPIVPENSRHGH
jgi:MoaA/NifB/PqqE/SkfB family radical SAM enzyme